MYQHTFTPFYDPFSSRMLALFKLTITKTKSSFSLAKIAKTITIITMVTITIMKLP